MLTLRSPLSQLRSIGSSTSAKLARLGITTARDLLSHFPIRHDDLRHTTTIASLRSGVTSVLSGRLQLVQTRRGFRRRRMAITEALLEDGTGTVKLVWFNQPYIGKSFQQGDAVVVVGKLSHGRYGSQLQAPLIERAHGAQLLAGRILPVYRTTAGLTQRQLRSFISAALPIASEIKDWLPEAVRTAEHLVALSSAVREIHFPSTPEKLQAARTRLKLGEVLLFSLSLLHDEQLRKNGRARSITFHESSTKEFVRSLPFTLTQDQRRAAWEILKDLEKTVPMNRLLEGDVGSGKTVLAAIAMHNVAANHRQAVLVAPTEILARQHHATLTNLLKQKHRLALWTRTQREWSLPGEPTKSKLLKALAQGSLDIVTGTHTLFSKNIAFPNLSLVVIDEQHRFGVSQRHALQTKLEHEQPHLLSMTATPIPRTLALALYGDLKLSFLKEMPPGRIPIQTKVVLPSEEDKIFKHIHNRAAADEQTYIVCPLIEESDNLGVAAATSEYERLKSRTLHDLRIGLLHGKLLSREKHAALDSFARGTTDVLVTTPVVEVGVDVPNATTMVIEGAERFGLAQLHQLRGRVGRSAKPSTCFLLTESDDPEVHERLRIVETTVDGFALAEEDLRRRGPGDLYGIRQSGLPEFKMASLTDVALMQRSQGIARNLLFQDPELTTMPLLKRKVDATYRTIHRE